VNFDLTPFIQTFLEESAEGLELMESSLLDLQSGDTDSLHAIFRAAHSIKGGAGTFGFAEVTDFTHLVETLLDRMRNGEHEVDDPTRNALLQSVDAIRALLTKPADPTLASALRPTLAALLDQEGPDVHDPAGGAPAPQGSAGWLIDFEPNPTLLQHGNDPLRLIAALEELGPVTVTADASHLPTLDQFDPELLYLRWHLVLDASCPRSSVDEVFEWVTDEARIHIEPAAMPQSGCRPEPGMHAPSPAPDRSAESLTEAVPQEGEPVVASRRSLSATATAATSETASIRVQTDKIDGIINLVGELVITQAMLGRLGEDLDLRSGESTSEHDDGELAAWLRDFRERMQQSLEQLERNSRELQEAVMRIRMLPIASVFNRMPRLVHDLSSRLGKKVDLLLSGEHTELDKTVLEKIGDPLTHLVRNGLDHGIETPEQRRAAGKAETGQLLLSARQQAGHVVIEIADDGAGLNRERILAKARERGLVGANGNLSDEQIHELIFEPGFSTAAEVSEVSGRGVGMDVVRRNIRALGGNVEVHSETGTGSRFVIRLPLTLAILDGQLVRIGDQVFVVPLLAIVESVQLRPDRFAHIADSELYPFRGDYAPVLRLRELLQLRSTPTAVTAPMDAQTPELLVFIESDGQILALTVDELLGQQQVVIKSLEANFRAVPGVSGATILGDGSVALILDPAGLRQLGRQRERPGNRHAA